MQALCAGSCKAGLKFLGILMGHTSACGPHLGWIALAEFLAVLGSAENLCLSWRLTDKKSLILRIY